MNQKKFPLIIKTQAGLEEILAGEIKQYGGHDVKTLRRAVKCMADNNTMYKLNYCCRTALRVLKEVHDFEASDEESLYQGVKEFDWFSLLDISRSIAINATISGSKMTHSHYVALKTKDAIVDKFREKFNKRPNVDLENPDLRIHIHITGTKCTVLTDSSGDSLHKRGYRIRQGEAPINEVLAAGMILLSGWDKKTNLLDPMCGSGTILCEANMIARNIPSGYFKNLFGFMRWKDFDKEAWEKIKEEENSNIQPLACKLMGSDVSMRALSLAEEILENTEFDTDIELKQVSFENSKPSDTEGGIIISNPPYGERMKKDDIRAFYKMIGDTLKTHYAGYEAWIITSDSSALKSVGLRTSRKIQLFNGPLECRYVKYELYKGSKKAKEIS